MHTCGTTAVVSG